jgi:flavodoxin I
MMKVLVVFDSVYGNTEKIARAVGAGITTPNSVKVVSVADVKQSDLQSIDLLIVGSPTHGGRATPALQQFFAQIPADGLKNVKITAFDTRISGKNKGFGVRLITKAFGYAAGRIASVLESKGGTLASPPEGFVVDKNEGPLKHGEAERATIWIKDHLITLHE